MITVDNLKKVLIDGWQYIQAGKAVYVKEYTEYSCSIKVDFNNKRIIYPVDKGMHIHRETTCNFEFNENFVVLECITRLLDKGYKPENIELEKPVPGGLDDNGGYCDILVKDNDGKRFLIIECKKEDEFEKYWKRTMNDGGQLFRYYNSFRQAQALCMYTSDWRDGHVKYITNIISMRDNDEFLQTNSSLKSFKQVQLNNGDKEEYFEVWKETYQQDFSTRGIFESDIAPYTIGKTKYSVKDLEEVDNNTIQKKYHEFATILRQHNVGSHENAFDKLVNLFLAKIVDETVNPNELQFYWKGSAYDDYYSLQDRLQKLYKEGMERFLGEKVTYIDQKQISDAFYLFRNDPDATKSKILEYFRQLKFYTNNDFSFLDVHNKALFYQNAVILKKMIVMLEDIKLKTKEQNQFLGDLFEGFLDDGVKQSEGQFFTPLPIVKFLVSSLPLEKIIRDNEEVPKAIDYACGAGHFLTEYALSIKPYIEKYKIIPVDDYYKEIYGIEKEYRLSKVSKVSTFMYGQDDIQIVYGDALAENKKIEDGKYSVLIANPPYSVKGFLEMLTENERNKYLLTKYVSDISKNRNIEAFFVERAKQLLAGNGIAAIILPSSILSNGNIYTQCREILLKYFEIISIVILGSGTFGKTGTETVTLFLRRREDELDMHYIRKAKREDLREVIEHL